MSHESEHSESGFYYLGELSHAEPVSVKCGLQTGVKCRLRVKCRLQTADQG